MIAAGALAYVLRPLLRRAGGQEVKRSDANVAIYKDQLRDLDAELAAGTLTSEDHSRARLELEQRLLEDVPAVEVERATAGGRRAALVVGIAIPILAVGVYFATGAPGALSPRPHEVEPTAEQINGMVARLAAKLRENPDDIDGWKLLGRSYMVMGRFPEAVAAYAKAAEKAPRDAQLLADFADALAMTRGEKLAGEPEQLVLRALQVDPNNLKALALAGTAAYERQDFAKAAELWGRMLPLVPADSEDARMISGNVEEAKKLAGIGGGEKPTVAGAHPGVRGTVTMSAEMKKQAKPDDLVFIFARAAEGPPMPLAVMRAKVGDLPVKFALDDSMAMAQGLKVSAFPKIVITARVSKSGSAKPAPGDLQGASEPVKNDASGVKVLIDSVVR
ncbi:MAG: c-type cytochrome biogenesis protein CcmI [Betaproteobacteria bacterium]|nr:c-type cytochrome biogenesis protein CcmI [Betaproteobacteria bacterium]MBV9362464.1 c-type cytochrome biogenesis protein CcmI [Betaproteobacteria bacterium]